MPPVPQASNARPLQLDASVVQSIQTVLGPEELLEAGGLVAAMCPLQTD